jgi:uncharacterized protein
MAMIALFVSLAFGGPICDQLLSENTSSDAISQAIADGDDPNGFCAWTTSGRDVPLIVAMIPIVGQVIGALSPAKSRVVTQKPTHLAIGRGDEAILRVLLNAGGDTPHDAIELAVHGGAWDCTQVLLDHGVTPNIDDLDTPIWGDTEQLQHLTDLGINLGSVQRVWHQEKGLEDVETVNAFLEAKLDAALVLRRAGESAPLDVVAALVARVDPGQSESRWALVEASSERRWEVVQMLVDAGVPIDPDPAMKFTDGPLHQAATFGQLDVMERLVALGANINAQQSNGATPLHDSAGMGELAAVRWLLEQGADPNRTDRLGRSPLSRAIDREHVETARFLLDHGASTADGEAAIAAVGQRNASLLRRLNPPPGTTDTFRRSLPVLALKKDFPEIFLILADKGVALDGGTRDTSVLFVAIADLDRAWVQRAVDHGADLRQVPDLDGAWKNASKDPAFAAWLAELGLPPGPEDFAETVRSGDVDEAARMLDRGAGIDVADRGGNTPLSIAIEAGDAALVAMLLDRGANPDLSSGFFNSAPISLALATGDLNIVRLVGEAKANLDISPARGRTPLIDAIYDGERDTAVLLLELGASPMFTDDEGEPPLFYAMQRRATTDLPDILLAAGATAEKINRSTIILALTNGRDDLVGPLLSVGAAANKDALTVAIKNDAVTSMDLLLQAGVSVTRETVAYWVSKCDRERLERYSWDFAVSSLVRRQSRECNKEIRKLLR